MKFCRRGVLPVICTTLIALLSGCASFPCNNLPEIDRLPNPSKKVSRPRVYLDLTFRTDLSTNRSNIVENGTGKAFLSEVVDEVTRETSLFEDYTLDSFKAEQMDYTLQIDVLHYGNITRATASLLGFIAGMSLFIIPLRATDNYLLTATLHNQDGRVLGKYEFEQCLRTWFHILMLPLSFKSPQKGTKAVLSNLVRNLYQSIDDVGVFGN